MPQENKLPKGRKKNPNNDPNLTKKNTAKALRQRAGRRARESIRLRRNAVTAQDSALADQALDSAMKANAASRRILKSLEPSARKKKSNLKAT